MLAWRCASMDGKKAKQALPHTSTGSVRRPASPKCDMFVNGPLRETDSRTETDVRRVSS